MTGGAVDQPTTMQRRVVRAKRPTLPAPPETTPLQKEKDDSLRAMKAVEATLQSAADENKTRLGKFEQQVREVREKLEASEAARELLAPRLENALREKELSRKAIEDGSAKEQVGCLLS